MQVHDRTDYLRHDFGCLSLCKLFRTHYLVEELSAIANLHHDMQVAVVDVAFVEFHDVGVVNFLQNCEFFFDERNVLFDVFSEDGLDSVLSVWV